MRKDEFLSSLERLLRSLKREERNKFLSYYSEMIDDYMEDGCGEEEAVERIGSPGEIAQEILTDREERPAKPTPAWLRVGVIVLLILGSPLWGSLVLAALCCALAAVILVLSAYVVIWCIPVIFGALSVSSLLLALVSTVGSAILLFQDRLGTDGSRDFICRHLCRGSTDHLGTGQKIRGSYNKIQQMACRFVSENERC